MKSYEIKWNHVIWDNILASNYLLEEKHISTVLILNENLGKWKWSAEIRARLILQCNFNI